MNDSGKDRGRYAVLPVCCRLSASAQAGTGRRPGRTRMRGAALMLALTALVVIGVIGTALTTLILAGARTMRAASLRDELLNIAESGAEAAISMLAAGAPGPWPRAVHVPGALSSGHGGAGRKRPGGTCSVSVTPTSDGGYEITSRARAAGTPGSAGAAPTCAVRLRVKEVSAGRFRVTDWSLPAGR